jgi:methylmalonyl-CoA mutase N-terminal domain/subunit
MALCSYDEAYTIPSKKAAKISLRTMQILADEMGLCDTVDPLGGSYYIEWLTNEMEKKISECMDQVEKKGGMIQAVESGYIQREVSRQAYLYEKRVQSGEIPKIGVNKYVSEETESREIEFHPFDPEVMNKQKKKLQEIRASRDTDTVEQALSELEQAARNETNLLPPILKAVRCYSSVGEITKIFKKVFGEFKEPVSI